MTTTRTRRTARAAGAGSGLLAGAAGVLAGEGLASVLGVTGPVVAVGNRVVDLTPRPVKEWAIETFGSADKLVLLSGVLVVLAVALAALGVVGVRHRAAALTGLTVLIALAAAAMLLDPAQGAGSWEVVACVAVMLGVGLGGLAWMLSSLQAPARDTGPRRRSVLAAASGVAAVGAVGAAARTVGDRSAGPQSLDLPQPATSADPVPSGVSFDVDGLTPHVTPTEDFYRVDTALQVPQVDARDHVLRITGMVDRPLELTVGDLLERDLVERRITMTCVSNPVGGDLLGTATWIGIPTRELLAGAGVQDGADAVRSVSTDGFTAGTPLGVLTDDRGALVALGMNGGPLPAEHGYPVRMVTPGLYGYVSATKWLTELEVTRFEDFTAYWTDRGYAAKAPIKLSSRIDVPGSFAQLDAGDVTVAGVAWAQTVGVERVEVRVDEGEWHDAELGVEDSDQTWRAWRWVWPAEPGNHRLEVRATDRAGKVQTSRREPIAPDGSTGWHSTTVTVS
ncbi:oxidoreductase, molybdopterin binding [Serinicoccus hydrothermalis]|uniref:Oxidoreductase, molybdopterin binding n=1 Tax=Serinicoccus hydrothermalis TaxID=1758689 RepID=A0A1B1N7P6_9MICO|nr:molybdopterin-dependent oxidoreductase [Serinicoccus hydrothermalis]ANS77450.1 oxidoreductase, molybdopterin binding [Serinicoccus hydrothermalis]